MKRVHVCIYVLMSPEHHLYVLDMSSNCLPILVTRGEKCWAHRGGNAGHTGEETLGTTGKEIWVHREENVGYTWEEMLGTTGEEVQRLIPGVSGFRAFLLNCHTDLGNSVSESKRK